MNQHQIAALPALEFGEPGEFRQWIVGEILAGRKTGSTNLVVAYAMNRTAIPLVGEHWALIDSTNRRVAVLRYLEVVRTSAAAIDERLALQEATSVEQWRGIHRDYWLTLVPAIRAHLGEPDWQLDDAEPAISTVFEVVEIIEPGRSLAFIGAGFHATRNLLPAAALAEIRIEAIATRDLNRSTAALARFGSDGVAYDSVERMLENPAISRVVVSAQPDDQLRLTLQAIAAGKNVFVEKPLGYSAAEAAQVADAADAAGVVLTVGFMKRFAPAYLRLKTALDAGELGELRSFQLTFGCDSTQFCPTEEDFLKLAAIHVVDLVRFLFGDVAQVHTASHSRGELVSMAAVLTFESGVVGTLDLSGLPSYSSETELLRVVGDAGVATVTDVAELRLHSVTPDATSGWHDLTETTSISRPAESAMSGVERDLRLRGFVGELVAFADGTGANGRDNVKTMALCDSILGRG